MAIDLPPPPMPELASRQAADTIRAAEDEPLQITLDSTQQIRVLGNSLLSQRQIARVFGGIDEPLEAEDAALALSQAYLDAGHLLVSVTWRPDATGRYTLYVHEGQFSKIEVPSDLDHYFDRFRADETPDANTFRRRALLASNHAELAGFTAFSTYQRDETVSYAIADTAMDVKVKLQPLGQTRISTTFSNTGNRFVGEYFAGLDASHAWSAGYRVRAAYSQSLSGQGSSSSDGDLARVSAGADWISPLGLLNFDYSNTDYNYARREVTLGIPSQRELDGETEVIKAAFGTLLFAGNHSRWTVGGAAESVDDQLRDSTGQTVLDERYQIVQLESSYATRLTGGNRPIAGAVTIKARQSIGSDIQAVGDSNVPSDSAEDSFSTALVSLSASRNLSDTWLFKIAAEQQFTSDPLPQYEEWVLGGFNQLPAYLPGVLVGDNGGYQTIQFGWTDLTPQQRISWLSSLSAELFVERGSAEFRGNAGGAEASIVDAGLRLSAGAWEDRLRLAVVVAESLDENNVSQATLDQLESDVFFSLSAAF